MMIVNRLSRDSGIVRDPGTSYSSYSGSTNQYGWTYEPVENIWCEGPDTIAVKTAKVITGRQFDSRSIGMSFPTSGKFNNFVTRIKANKKTLAPVAGQNSILTGGPLRKIRIEFGQVSKSYRFVPTDTNLNSAPYGSYADVPFSVYAIDELDSSGGTPKQLKKHCIP